MLLGGIATILAFALFVSTGMIYACLRFLQEWHTPLTVVNFILLGSASGFTLATLYAAVFSPSQVSFLGNWAIIITVFAFVGRSASLWRNARLKSKSTTQTAIGVKHPRIVQKTQGSMGGSFNTREFFHGKSELFVRKVKAGFLLMAFALPVLLLAINTNVHSLLLLCIAFFSQYFGLLAERWYFFAEARHPQNLYYQTIS